MHTVAQSPTAHKRIAYHATFEGVHGTAIRNHRGEVWFLSDADHAQRLTDADAPALLLHGRVDVAAEQRLADLAAGTDLTVLEARKREAAIMAT
jgi:hypothetical protein